MGENASSADIWATGAAHEPYVGRWSRLVAREFIQWLAVPPESRWLDVGCGTGALSQTILQNERRDFLSLVGTAQLNFVGCLKKTEGGRNTSVSYTRTEVLLTRSMAQIGNIKSTLLKGGSNYAAADAQS